MLIKRSFRPKHIICQETKRLLLEPPGGGGGKGLVKEECFWKCNGHFHKVITIRLKAGSTDREIRSQSD